MHVAGEYGLGPMDPILQKNIRITKKANAAGFWVLENIERENDRMAWRCPDYALILVTYDELNVAVERYLAQNALLQKKDD